MKISQKFWFQLHGWCSLPVWLIFTAVCLTGTIAVLSHELTWLFNENARALNPENLAAKPVAELVAAVLAAEPGAAVTSVMVMEPYLVTAVLFTTETMPAAIAYVNPYTAVVQEINPGLNFISFMRSLHGWLLFPWQHSYSLGYYLVSAMSLLMLGALITGLIIYKRFWQSFTAPKLRLQQGKKTVLADLHRLAGVWSIWFLLLMSLTGLWYLLQAVLWHNEVEFYYEVEPLSSLAVPKATAEGQVPGMIPLAQALTTAQQFLPQLQPAFIAMPEHPRDYYRISGYGDSIWFDQYSYTVWVNPWTGAVADSRVPAQMAGLETLMSVADPLHYGTIGGLWTKMIWFLFGLLVSGMAISGFMIWGSRTVRASRSGVAHNHANTSDHNTVGTLAQTGAKKMKQPAHNFAFYWTRYKFKLSGLVLILPFWFLYQSLHQQFPQALPKAQLGPFDVSVMPLTEDGPYPHHGEWVKDYYLQWCKGCAEKIRQGFLLVSDSPPDLATLTQNHSSLLHGNKHGLHVHASTPPQLQSGDKLWLIIEDWQGQVYSHHWVL